MQILEDGTYDNTKGFFGNYDVGADMASQMGFIKGTQAHEDMADKIEDLIDDGGYEELHQAIKKSIEAEEKNIETAEKVVQERNNFAAAGCGNNANAKKTTERRCFFYGCKSSQKY